MKTYTETVYRYRVMRQLNDPHSNPEGAWSLIFSTPDLPVAVEEVKEQIERWARTGDAFKIVDAVTPVQYIERPAY